jgi:4-hydroxyphenylacetate decarboxylase small subunit
MKHNDCLNFSSIDAAKGICRLTKQLINIDSGVCEHLKLAPKCKNCKSFEKTSAAGTGICRGLSKEDWTYESLNAVTCRGYEANEA